MAWIVWGIYAAARIALFCLSKAPMDAFALGELIGSVVGTLLIPVILAMLVWRLSGRSVVAGNAVYFVVLVLSVAGQTLQSVNRAQAIAAMDQVQKEQKALRDEQSAAAAQGRQFDSTKLDKLVERESAQMGALAQNSSGRERATAEGGKAFMEQLLAAKKRYDSAIKALDFAHFWSLPAFTPGAPAEERRKVVREFAQANTGLIGFQDEDATVMRRVLLEHGASPADIQQAVTGYRQSAGARLPILKMLRQADADLAQLMLEYIDFEEANQGKWQVDEASKKINFQKDTQLAQYNELMKRLKTLVTAEADYQKQILAIKN